MIPGLTPGASNSRSTVVTNPGRKPGVGAGVSDGCHFPVKSLMTAKSDRGMPSAYDNVWTTE